MVQLIEKTSANTDADQRSASADDVHAEAVILICEPDATLRKSIVELLRSAGFATVLGTADMDDAAGLCAEMPPHVALFRATDGDPIDRAFTDALKRLSPAHAPSVIYLYTGTAPTGMAALLKHGDDALSLDHDIEGLSHRVFTHAALRLLERALHAERSALEELIEKRTDRLNKALDLLREAGRRLEGELAAAKSETRKRIDYFAETQHELRTPLNAICGMSDAIRKQMFGELDNPKYKEYADNIYQSGQHLLAIIDGRLELSRIEAGADPIKIETVDVGSVIRETTEMLGRIAEQANVSLEVDLEPGLPVIETDRLKLRQVLINLVANAIKFTPEKGRVLLSVKRNAQKGVLILVISDNGIGMSENEVRDAVKPYRRLSGDRRSGKRGAGLGLAIVRKLVETLGATIELQSKPGQGTTVKVELPMALASAPAAIA